MATSISALVDEMGRLRGKSTGQTESGVFVVRTGAEGVIAMARVDRARGVTDDAKGNNVVTRRQFDELISRGIPFELISAPSSYRPPAVKIRK